MRLFLKEESALPFKIQHKQLVTTELEHHLFQT